MKKYTADITEHGFKIIDMNGNVILDQMFNPITGENFNSYEDVQFYVNSNYGELLDQDILFEDEFIKNTTLEIVDKVTNILNNLAKSFKYDNIDSVSKYLFITPDIESDTYEIQLRYKQEAILLSNYAAECWAYLESTMKKILSKEQDFISIDDLVNSIPKFNNEH